jgi:hypothetical protein
MKYIQAYCNITALIVVLSLTHRPAAFCSQPTDTSTRKTTLIDSLKDGEVYKLVINQFGCWNGSIFTMEITKTGDRYIVRCTDTLMESYQKLPQKVIGPALVNAAGLDSIRAMEIEMASPPAVPGRIPVGCWMRYTITLGQVQKSYTVQHCFYAYRPRLQWLIKDLAVRSVIF